MCNQGNLSQLIIKPGDVVMIFTRSIYLVEDVNIARLLNQTVTRKTARWMKGEHVSLSGMLMEE